MKSGKIPSNIVQLLFLLSLIILTTANDFSQSGQVNKSETQTSQPVQPADGAEDKSDEVSKLELYEYIEPVLIKPFLKKLNEFGAKGYRVRDLTQSPYIREVGDSSAWGTKLAGIVRLDETKYEYKFIEVEGIGDLTAELNRESKDGFNLCEIITYQSSIGFEQEADDAMFKNLQTLLSLPQMHNLILLERETGKEIAPRQFQLLKAGFGIGKNPTEKMRTLLDESAKQNFYPIGAYMSFGFAAPEPNKSKWKIADNYYGVILEKSEEKQSVQLQFVRAALQGTFKKRVNKLAQDGFRMSSGRFTVGFMYKNEETPTLPLNYQWINADAKTLADDLLKLSDTGARFHGTSLHLSFLTGVLTESDLIFEQPTAADKTRYEYLPLKMVNDTPQPVLIAKTIIPPDEPMRKFRRLIRQGYTFANLIYTGEEITALFERRRSDIK